MEISADKAYWLLHSFKTRSKCLLFGCRFADEYAMCEATVVSVERLRQIVEVQLRDDNGNPKSRLSVPIDDATFYLSRIGEPGFPEWNAPEFHMMLEFVYPDSMTIVLAERAC
jgi:hypothetical protein